MNGAESYASREQAQSDPARPMAPAFRLRATTVPAHLTRAGPHRLTVPAKPIAAGQHILRQAIVTLKAGLCRPDISPRQSRMGSGRRVSPSIAAEESTVPAGN